MAADGSFSVRIHGRCRRSGFRQSLPPAEAGVEADLDAVIAAGEAGEDDEPTAEASAEHRAQGRADALLGFSETRNPWPEGTRAHASYRDGWVQGEAERQAAAFAIAG